MRKYYFKKMCSHFENGKRCRNKGRNWIKIRKWPEGIVKRQYFCNEHNPNKYMENIKKEMLSQDKRITSWPIFIVVRDKKIYGIDDWWTDGRERKDYDLIDFDNDICEDCLKYYEKTGDLPEECDDYKCYESFINYRIEKDVPQLRAGFFFTAKACNEHIKVNRHHYGEDAHSYAISAYNNEELQKVMLNIIGKENEDKLK